jgi:3-oxoacyl-[acyl-carrier-protein] synthase III
MIRNIRLVSSGHCLPKLKLGASDIDTRMGAPCGTAFRYSGVQTRYWASDESVSKMAAAAVQSALAENGLSLGDIDALICASGGMEQQVPYGAALIKKALGATDLDFPCFDVNSTCLSFVTGLDMASYLIEAGRFNRVVLVSSEIASIALNPKDPESFSLLGDGACAFVIDRSTTSDGSRILSSGMKTYAAGVDLCWVGGWGNGTHPRGYVDGDPEWMFRMDGRKVYKLAAKHMLAFLTGVADQAKTLLKEIDLFVPHQASKSAMELIRARLEIPTEKWMTIIENYGNMISVSIPLALRMAIKQDRVRRGDKVMLLGTSAGFSLGAVVLQY